MNKNPTKTNFVDEFIHNNAWVNDPKHIVNNFNHYFTNDLSFWHPFLNGVLSSPELFLAY